MARIIPILVLACTAALGSGLDIHGVTLDGGGGEYIETQRPGATYVLSCDYRTGYDDPVVRVRWLLYGSLVYEWTAAGEPTAYGPLLGRVDRSPAAEPHNLHFTALDYSLAGNYTCEVVTQAANTARASYTLHLLDISSAPFETSVDILKEAMGGDEDKYITDTEDTMDALVDFEDAECTLVWSVSTPAIFPKPNVTCGFFSLLHDDVVARLPAGLTMHQYTNRSWRATFHDTHVQVSTVPRDTRLGCVVRIPGTTYKETLLPEDDFRIDNLLEPAGCPSLGVDGSGLLVEVRDGTTTCRGDLLPATRDHPVHATIRCPPGFGAVFPDGSVEHGWALSASCQAYEQRWRNAQDPDQDVDVAQFPSCHPVIIASGQGAATGSVLVLLPLLLVWPFPPLR